MRHKSFGSFVDKKKRDSIKHLKIVKKVLEHGGMIVEDFVDTDANDDPYVYCVNPTKNGSFNGIRIYKIGDQIAFRVQKESKTHPYGSAYPLPVEEMFSDFLSDEGTDQRKAGNKVMESLVKEIKSFFEKSIEAEKNEKDKSIEISVDSTSGTDYGSMIR